MSWRNKLIVDSRDAYDEYGIFIAQGGYKGVIQKPVFKKLTTTEWAEFDGIEVDLITPVLDSRQFQIQFNVTNVRYAEDFFEDMSDGAYHTFQFVEIGKSYNLRMVQCGSFSELVKMGKMTLTFADDFPTVPTGTPYNIGQSEVFRSGFEIDGVDMSQFGSWVLKGSDESIRKMANVREALKIDVKSVAGLQYDGENVRFKAKDVTLKLLIKASSVREFWKRYDALYAILMSPETRYFYYAELGAEYECYYKNNSVLRFEILGGGRVWCEFSVVLTFTNYHPVSSWMLLATEDYDFVVTEDNKKSKIIIRPKYGIALICTEDGKYVITESDADYIYVNNKN